MTTALIRKGHSWSSTEGKTCTGQMNIQLGEVMKKICVVTATRAEYGVLRPLIKQIREDDMVKLCLVVTGTHLSGKFGYTLDEIKNDGFPIAEKIPILEDDFSKKGICNIMGNAAKLFNLLASKDLSVDMIIQSYARRSNNTNDIAFTIANVK